MTSSEIIKTIKKAKNIAIFAHKNPDADALGSAFAVREICRDFGKRAEFFSTTDSDYLKQIFPLNELKKDFQAKDFDLVIVCDLHANSRYDQTFLTELEKAENVLMIDHHEDSGEPKLAAAKALIQPEKSATCEILFDICKKEKVEITSKIATYLWAGIIGDTGRFLHSNLTEHVLAVARELLVCGAEVQHVYDAMFRSISRKEMELRGQFLNRICYACDDKAAYAIFTQKDMKKAEVYEEKYKAFSGDMVKIEGVQASILCLETQKNHFKFSVRSNGVDCSKLCAKLGGGGHKNASGFELDINLRAVKSQICGWLEEILREKNVRLNVQSKWNYRT